jgi:hypothetical protein
MAATAENVFDTLKTPIGGVQPNQLLAVWNKVDPLLKRVVTPQTGYTTEHVLAQLQLANWQLWVIGDFQGVVVTHIERRPLFSVLWVRFLAGSNVDEWLDDLAAVTEAFARHHGCRRIEFAGRHGWRKFRGRFRDYEPIYQTYSKEL